MFLNLENNRHPYLWIGLIEGKLFRTFNLVELVQAQDDIFLCVLLVELLHWCRLTLG